MPWGSGIFITIGSIMLEIFFPLPTTNSCQKSLLTLRSAVRMAAPTWVGPLRNVGNTVDIWGMGRVLEMKATQCMCTPGPTREKQQPYLIFPLSHQSAPAGSFGFLALAGVALGSSG